MPRAFAAFALCIGTTLLSPAAVLAQAEPGPGLSGAYLAGRAAALDGDQQAAARFFERALIADPGNGLIAGNAIYARAAMGDWARAAELADAADDTPGARELADLARFVLAVRSGNFAEAAEAIAAQQAGGPLIDGLAEAWLRFGGGDMTGAVAAFEAVAEEPTLANLARTHLGYARAAVGDFEGADLILSGEAFGPVTMTERTIRARAEILAQLDRRDEAVALLTRFTDAVPDPSILALQARLATETAPRPYAFITTAQQGVAEVFFSVARALEADGQAGGLPVLYGQAARGIDPDHGQAAMFVARMFLEQGQHELAAESFATVPPDSDNYVEAQAGRAEALYEAGAADEAIALLRAVTAERPGLSSIYAALGDLLRREDRCGEAIEAYSEAIDAMDDSQESAWFLFYTRAICYEQTDNWPPAEADFRRALELNPEQPNVLNYLGYSLVEQRRNFDEALDMIERAVAGRPDSGYITDSLGWVLYRLGRFEEAVAPMERAVELAPYEPIILDHLGDVYWMVGRYREAEFQWNRALSFEPEPDVADRIRRKLDMGLYEVLEAEGGVGAIQ